MRAECGNQLRHGGCEVDPGGGHAVALVENGLAGGAQDRDDLIWGCGGDGA